MTTLNGCHLPGLLLATSWMLLKLSEVDGDGRDWDCTFTGILQVEAALPRTCVLIEGGRVRCWGQNNQGQLGYGYTQDIGDDELLSSAGDSGLPVTAVDLMRNRPV